MNTAIVGHNGHRCWIGELIMPVFNGRGIQPGEIMDGVDCAIWAAPHNWPHGGDVQSDLDMLQETADFTRFLQACRQAGVPRIIYCSSMNVTYHDYGVNPDYYRGFDPVLNFFTQGKIACEGLLRAYANCVEGASCTSLRLGWYPGDETNRHDLNRIRMTDADVLNWFDQAKQAGAGFRVIQMSRGKW